MKIPLCRACVLLLLYFSLECRGSNQFLRKKRYILWKEGLNWVQTIVGFSFPVDIKDASVSIGAAMKAYYVLPTNTSNFKPQDYGNEGKSFFTRWNIYKIIEQYFERYDFGDGKACLLNLICETSSFPFERRTILEETLYTILMPSTTNKNCNIDKEYIAAENLGKNDVNCNKLFPECKIGSILKLFTTVIK